MVNIWLIYGWYMVDIWLIVINDKSNISLTQVAHIFHWTYVLNISKCAFESRIHPQKFAMRKTLTIRGVFGHPVRQLAF